MRPAGKLLRQGQKALGYFRAYQDLKSDDPSVRRPAISTLIALAQQSARPIGIRASLALTREFGPFAVTEGLGGCAAPLAVVHKCDAEDWDCRTCPWLWRPQSPMCSQLLLLDAAETT